MLFLRWEGVQDAWGRAALHWAAQRGHERTVALLIVRDAIVDAKSFPTMKHAGKTAADLAAESGHFGIAAFLAELTVMQKLDKDDQESCHGINPGMEWLNDVTLKVRWSRERGPASFTSYMDMGRHTLQMMTTFQTWDRGAHCFPTSKLSCCTA